MRTRAYWLVIIILAISGAVMLHAGQGTTPAPRAVSPSPVLPSVDATSQAALKPLAAQRDAIMVQYQQLASQWRIAEGKALANASLDPGQYGVDSTGTKFISRRPQNGGL